MNSAKFAIKRPVFIGCVVILMVVLGLIGMNRMGVDLLPSIEFPVVTVTTVYAGATPEEIEKLISKPLEEQISTISGLKRLSSRNLEGVSVVIAEFGYDMDIKYAEEKMREKVSLARNELPQDLLDEPLLRQFDFTNQPVVTLAIMADLKQTELYDIAKEQIKPMIEQVSGVGEIRLTGGTRREIQVELDRNKMNEYEISAQTIAEQIRISGTNIPVGKYDRGTRMTLFRTIGEFNTVDQIRKTVVSFSGDVGNTISLDRVGTVTDSAEDLKTIAYLHYPQEENNRNTGVFKKFFSKKIKQENRFEIRSCILVDVYKQSGANSVAVADGVKNRIISVNNVIRENPGNPKLSYVYDTAKYIRTNVLDVRDTLIIGIILTILVVYLFLGNIRSTIITGIAIPNSILGAFVLMYFMGFTVNIMTLMALSLTVGLLVDDAIVVRENIFRKLENGASSEEAAEKGTTEVMLAVIATTLTIIAVFLPIAFLSGVVGRFMRPFGLSVVFAMMISLFDALTVAPLLSAYFAGTGERATNRIVTTFERFQNWLIKSYNTMLEFSLRRPLVIVLITGIVFICSLFAFGSMGKTFEPQGDITEMALNVELSAGTNIQGTRETVMAIYEKIKKIPEIHHMSILIGTNDGEYNLGSIGIFLKPFSERERSSDEIKTEIREMMKEFASAKPSIDEYGSSGGMNKPFILNIKGTDITVLNEYGAKVMERLKLIPDLTEITTSDERGKPEFQVHLDEERMKILGVSNVMAGSELRYHIEGGIVGKLHDKGLEYDVRLRLKPEQRDLEKYFFQTRVPNLHNKLIPLSAISTGKKDFGPSKILRQDRSRVVQIYANLAPGGAVGTAIEKTKNIFDKELPLPRGISYSFIGAASDFEDTIAGIVTAFALSLLFIYLVLASLYESFITPIIIFFALPPALSGAFYALAASGMVMDIFTMIGIIMLLGIVTKNSILLVDFAMEGVHSGLDRKEAITRAGHLRFRPILMTTFAMLAGTLPLALGIGEASQFRQGMGIAIMGGLTLSTIITLLVVPAVFEYIDSFREFVESKFRIKKRENAPDPEPVTVSAKPTVKSGKKKTSADVGGETQN